jgi:predicted membrane GTPase involved in stress response
VINEVFDLFAALDADRRPARFSDPLRFGRNGWMAMERPVRWKLSPLFDLVVEACACTVC